MKFQGKVIARKRRERKTIHINGYRALMRAIGEHLAKGGAVEFDHKLLNEATNIDEITFKFL